MDDCCRNHTMYFNERSETVSMEAVAEIEKSRAVREASERWSQAGPALIGGVRITMRERGHEDLICRVLNENTR